MKMTNNTLSLGSIALLSCLFLLYFMYTSHNPINRVFEFKNDKRSSERISSRNPGLTNSDYITNNNEKLLQCSRIIMKKILQCQLAVLETTKNFWADLTRTITECSWVLQRSLKIKPLYNKDDVKYFILPTDYNEQVKNSTNCFTLTIGICFLVLFFRQQ